MRSFIFILILYIALFCGANPPPPHSPTPQQWIDGGGDTALVGFTFNDGSTGTVSYSAITELSLTPPPLFVTNIVYVIPSNTVIRIQVRDDLTKDEWYEPVVFKSKTQYKYFRVVFETESGD